ncbi:FAD-dependent monooxygenase [Mycolicibacterium hippocampi]|uniref:FAD-dependent monooxygenase n=1 Tax=Mycolicibacterium hippocampi TaxID=659824 RepID=UPI0013D4BAAA|nr:FAD-dependent monooxygenase [Mycolicibacterium hippocampi]
MINSGVEETDVLIVGGSLVGLSAAVFLASSGVRALLVERHLGSSQHPRAIGYTTRTVEMFRQAGIALPASTAPGPPGRARVESLTGAWHETNGWAAPTCRPAEPGQYSPVAGSTIAQDSLEPILRSRATELGADLRLGEELISFAHNDEAVTATVRRRADGSAHQIRAAYLVAADGANSPVRSQLGITRGGRGLLSVQRSVLFRAPLERYLRNGIVQFEIKQPGLDAFLASYGDGRWVLMVTGDIERSEQQHISLIRRAAGIADLPVEIITDGRWELAAWIAAHFGSGRIFLTGDAAHQLPPNRGGYGANTGIADAHNLSWKLASVLNGQSSPALLDTYDAERRPVALLRHDQIFARSDFKGHLDTDTDDVEVIDDIAMELGQLYRSAALPTASDDLPPVRRPDQWAGQPGTRAPHLWFDDDKRQSLLDFYGQGWVVVADGGAWTSAARRVSTDLEISLTAVPVPAGTTAHHNFMALYGLGPGGACLIRPDGHIAAHFETAPASRVTALTEALTAAVMLRERLVVQLSHLGDRDALVALTIRYADAINRGYDGKTIEPELFSQIFSHDATYTMPGEDPYVGLEAVVSALPAATAAVPFAMHAFVNPILDIGKTTATARWLMWLVARPTDADLRTGYVQTSFSYTRTSAGWRIRSVVVHPGGIQIPQPGAVRHE